MAEAAAHHPALRHSDFAEVFAPDALPPGDDFCTRRSPTVRPVRWVPDSKQRTRRTNLVAKLKFGISVDVGTTLHFLRCRYVSVDSIHQNFVAELIQAHEPRQALWRPPSIACDSLNVPCDEVIQTRLWQQPTR